ncbi:enoyl-CoA hydratase/isomerase family protein [Gracilimonas mengyeensis]|uniref:Enoyl-CoA hydratase n=1 Tax=Gracilimonas mengyeensis TaxID=1302730 RepID=A0A521FH42_9BACT|nr:enoyl-CoA hydratase-related protein [Gracilimonas mengyeensis]SMO95445.1 enoyl-CoA hydratase [Gracilimonas mengyeensis]
MIKQDFETLLLAIDDDGICTLTINRPEKLNALNNLVLEELDEAFDAINEEYKIRAVVITGAGEKAFVAGADIKELSTLDPASGEKVSKKGQDIFQKIEDMTIPVIAAVNGYALGGGCELALGCHLRIASTNAAMGLPEVSLGLIPGYGGTQRLTQAVGKAKALECIMTGRQIKADEAFEIGLVNQVVDGNPVEEAKAMLQKILKQGPVAIKNAILAVNEAGTEDGFETEAKLFGELCGTADFKEGTTAFLEKRKPNFSGK